MKVAIFCCILAVAVCHSAGKFIRQSPHLDGRIVGGEETTIEEVPYQISMEFLGSHRCGGSILNETVILSAAHCVDGIGSTYLKIRAGSTLLGEGGVLVKVAKVIKNQDYNAYTIDHDSSLLILEEPLIFSDKIQPVALPSEEEYLDEPELSLVSGWGTLSSGGPLPKNLQKVVVPIVSQQACKDAYTGYTISDRMICAGYLGEGGKDACQGDSGGPLVANGKVHGITSWGLGCAARDYPGVYTRVTAVRKWIRDQINL